MKALKKEVTNMGQCPKFDTPLPELEASLSEIVLGG